MQQPSPSRRSATGPSLSRNAREGLSATIERHLRDYFAAHERGLPASGLYSRILQEIERPLLAIALAECRGNQLRAAALLGLNRNTLRKKIRSLGLNAGRSKQAAQSRLCDAEFNSASHRVVAPKKNGAGE